MVAIPRIPKPDPPARPSRIVVELTAKSSHAYLGLLAVGALITDLQEEFPWREDLKEAGRLLLEIALDLDLRPAEK